MFEVSVYGWLLPLAGLCKVTIVANVRITARRSTTASLNGVPAEQLADFVGLCFEPTERYDFRPLRRGGLEISLPDHQADSYTWRRPGNEICQFVQN